MSVIDIYADIWCPFAHVGLRSVLRRRNQLGRDDVVVRVRAWPLELVNGVPLDPTATAGHVDDLRTQVASDLFTQFDPERFPQTSLPALALAAAGYRQDNRTGESVSVALRSALFEEGRDVSDPEVLTGVASINGLGHPTPEDDDSVRRDWHEGESRGVRGSPHFFCGEVDAFCPSLVITKDQDGQPHITRNMEGLDRFLAECFKLR